MALRIRNMDVERLAREVAHETGETITQAIAKSLEERLMRLSGRKVEGDLAQDIVRIGARCAALGNIDPRSPVEILGYGPDGAPR